MRRAKLPPIVRCHRCGSVLMEVRPTGRKTVVCAECLGVDLDAGRCWICCEALPPPQRRGYCVRCRPLQPG
jgi:hypothetical protein